MTQNETCLVDFRFSTKLSPLDSCFIELFTVNPLLSPPGGLIFFQVLLRGSLIERGGLKEKGGLI